MAAPSGRPRFFVPAPEAAAGFSAGQELDFPPAEAHHAAHVLRLKAGDAVDLFDGGGGSAAARLVRAHHGKVAAAVEAVRPAAARPRPLVHLAFAVPKGNRLDWLLEKATELGVASLRPVRFERSVAGGETLSAAKRERWFGHCIAAAKQAGLDFLPSLEPPLALESFLESAPAGLFGDLSSEAVSLAAAARQTPPAPDGFWVAVGPEGGLTDDERRRLIAAGWRGVRLGHTVLRVETAAVALVAALLALTDTPHDGCKA